MALRVTVSDKPIRRGQDLFCVAHVLAGSQISQEKAVGRLYRQMSAPPFSVNGLLSEHHTLIAPWGERHALQRALGSLISPDSIGVQADEMARVVNRNTLASLLSVPCGVLSHLLGPRHRKWRFAHFTLVETVGLTGLTWTVTGDPINAHAVVHPTVVLRARWNTALARRSLAMKLGLATGLQL